MLKTYSIAYRTPYLSDCIQPPVLAEAVQRRPRGEGGRGFLDEVLPKVRRYYDWLDRVRDPDRDGLIATLQPDESGLDHTPEVRRVSRHRGHRPRGLHRGLGARGRPVRGGRPRSREDVRASTASSARTCSSTPSTARTSACSATCSSRWATPPARPTMRARAAHTTEGLVSKCYDAEAGLFFDLAGRREERLRVNTVSSLMPLALPDLPAKVAERSSGTSRTSASTRRRFPVPSVAMNEPSYAPGVVGTKLVWRGPSLDEHELVPGARLATPRRADLARHIEDRSGALVERDGLPRVLPPDDGRGERRAGLLLDGVCGRPVGVVRDGVKADR